MPSRELAQLLNNEKFSDVTFLVGEKQTPVYANKALLAVSSDRFESLLYPGEEEEHKGRPLKIFLPDVDPKIFLQLLNFVYTNQVVVDECNANSLIICAKRFGVEKVCELCEQFFDGHLNNDNCVTLYMQCEQDGAQQLARRCEQYISKSAKHIFRTNLHFPLGKEQLAHLMKCDLRIREIDLFNAIMRWVSFYTPEQDQNSNNTQLAREFLPLFNFSAIRAKDMVIHVFPRKDLLNEEEQLAILHEKILNDDKLSNVRRYTEFNPVIKQQQSYEQLIAEGWRVVYHYGFNHSTTNNELNQLCSLAGDDTLLCCAAKKKDSDEIKLCAFGKAKEVLVPQGSGSSTVQHGQVYWYFVEGQSFGFADAENISLNSADTCSGELRMSWHLSGGGGYRIGETKNMNEDKEYDKLILFID